MNTMNREYTSKYTRDLVFPDPNWVPSSPFSLEEDDRVLLSINHGFRGKCFLKHCHLLQMYQLLNGQTTVISARGRWIPLSSWKRHTKKKYNDNPGKYNAICKEAIETIDPNFFEVKSNLYVGVLYYDSEILEIVDRQRLVESYLSRDEEKCFHANWCDDHNIPASTMVNWLKNSFYNLRLRQEVIDIPQWLGEGYGRVVPGNPEEDMKYADTLLTFCTHNLNIQDDEDGDEQRLTVINLPQGRIQCDDKDDRDMHSRVKKCYDEYGRHQTCSVVETCNFCNERGREFIHFASSYDTTPTLFDDDENEWEIHQKQQFAEYFARHDHPLWLDATYNTNIFLTNNENGCRVTTASNGVIADYHKRDANRMIVDIHSLRREAAITSQYQSELLLDQDDTNLHNRLDDLDDLDDDSINNNAEGIVFIDDAVNDKSPLINNTLATGTTHDETNDEEDEDDILVPLHDIIDDNGLQETEDTDCHLASLFNVNIGAGGSVELSELTGIDTDSRFVNLLGFSHRWAELDPKDRRRTILLLRDAIEWLIVNVFPRIRHLLPDESSVNVGLEDNDNDDNDNQVVAIQKLWFVHNYIVVCCLFNRIIKCVPWVYIEPLDLLKKSAMSKPQLRIIYQIRSWLIDRACKSRWVKKECYTDDGTTISVWVIPLLYILASHCTGGAHSILLSCFRLAAPGVAECHVLKRNRYFVNPFTARVYTNVYYNKIPFLLQKTHVVQLKQHQQGGYRWCINFNLNGPPRDTGDGDLHAYRTTKKVGLSRVVHSCVFPSVCPLGTMDHIDAHQHNGIQNVENCQKPENLDRKGSAILVHPSNVSFSSSEAVQP